MKHISAFLQTRKQEFAARASEKGSREWNTFEIVRGDHVDAYPVRTAYRPAQRYANVVPIRRLRQRSLFEQTKTA